MYILHSYSDGKYGILDTKDFVIEYYDLNTILLNFSHVNIVGLDKSVGSIQLFPYIYCLMNKDKLVCYFYVDTSKSIYQLDDLHYSPLPYKMTDLHTWLQNRLLINNRFDIEEFFNSLGISTMIDYISITHLVSLNDTFWVKSIEDKETWSSISPYCNKFNDVIAHYSFHGTINGKFIGDSSPDLSLGGSFQKCWRRKDNVVQLIKSGSSGALNAGREPFSEIYCMQLAKYLGLYDVLEYRLIKYNNILCTSCDLFTNEKTGIIDARLYTGQRETDYSVLFNLLNNKNKCRLKQILCLDILTLNGDRHFGNISLYIDNDTQEVGDISIIYDNNLALIPYYTEDEDLQSYISSLRAKDGSTFINLYKSIRDSFTDEIMRKALNFNFTEIVKHPKMNNERLTLLSNIVRNQAKLCLEG